MKLKKRLMKKSTIIGSIFLILGTGVGGSLGVIKGCSDFSDHGRPAYKINKKDANTLEKIIASYFELQKRKKFFQKKIISLKMM